MRAKMVADMYTVYEEESYLDSYTHEAPSSSDDEFAQPIGLLIILRPQMPYQHAPEDSF